jgi:hypothetical protein
MTSDVSKIKALTDQQQPFFPAENEPPSTAPKKRVKTTPTINVKMEKASDGSDDEDEDDDGDEDGAEVPVLAATA